MIIEHLFSQLFISKSAHFGSRFLFQLAETPKPEVVEPTDEEMEVTGEFDRRDIAFDEAALRSEADAEIRAAQAKADELAALKEAVRVDRVMHGPEDPITRESERQLEFAQAATASLRERAETALAQGDTLGAAALFGEARKEEEMKAELAHAEAFTRGVSTEPITLPTGPNSIEVATQAAQKAVVARGKKGLGDRFTALFDRVFTKRPAGNEPRDGIARK